MKNVMMLVTLFLVVPLAGCPSLPESKRDTTSASGKSKGDDWYSCVWTIEEGKQGPEVETAKATLGRLAFQPGNNDALYYFISLVPESPQRPEALQRCADFIKTTVNSFRMGDRTLIIRGTRTIPGPPIFGIGATVTINGFFTKEKMRYYAVYSWPTAPLTVQQGIRELNVTEGEGVILDYDNGKAYIFGCDFLK